MASGELTVDVRGPDWRANIGGFTAAVKHGGD